MKALGSETDGLSDFDEKEVVEVDDDVVSPAVLAASAANVERTDVMMYWEEVEAASLSATSAAIAAADFLDVWSGFALASVDAVDGFGSNTRSSPNCFRMFVASSTCACATCF